jgi:hypothetical protein
MERKRGQVTIFVIVTLLIFVIIGILIIQINKSNNSSVEFIEINDYVENCLEDSFLKSAIFYGNQNVNYNNSQDYGNLSLVSIPIYGSDEADDSHSIEGVIEILELYSLTYFDECINNFSILESENYEIVAKDEKRILIELEDKKVLMSLRYPLTLVKGEKTHEYGDFSTEVNFDFLKIHGVLSDFIDEHDKNPLYIPMGYIATLTFTDDISVQMFDFPENIVIYEFQFNDDKILGKPYSLVFGIIYDSIDPQLFDEYYHINLTAIVGEEFSYTIEAVEDTTKFEDYSLLFDIDEDSGLITFTPESKDIGNHVFIITMYDGDIEEFVKINLEVKENE